MKKTGSRKFRWTVHLISKSEHCKKEYFLGEGGKGDVRVDPDLCNIVNDPDPGRTIYLDPGPGKCFGWRRLRKGRTTSLPSNTKDTNTV